jgi:hypothetical protein
MERYRFHADGSLFYVTFTIVVCSMPNPLDGVTAFR